MAMLAERKRKQKFTLNPRGKFWSEDRNKFGQKMLEKMGWSSGKGLGAKEDGITENLKVKYKNDASGFGFEDKDNAWTQHEVKFSKLLGNLTAENSPESSNDGITKTKKSLEEMSKNIKSRVHYHKFTRSKDLSKISNKDLMSIFGKKENPTVGLVNFAFDNNANENNSTNIKTEITDFGLTNFGFTDFEDQSDIAEYNQTNITEPGNLKNKFKKMFVKNSDNSIGQKEILKAESEIINKEEFSKNNKKKRKVEYYDNDRNGLRDNYKQMFIKSNDDSIGRKENVKSEDLESNKNKMPDSENISSTDLIFANARNKYKQIFIKSSENIPGTIQNDEILENQQEMNDKSNKKCKRKSDTFDETNHKRKSKLFKHNKEEYSIYNGIDNLGCTANSEEPKTENLEVESNKKIVPDSETIGNADLIFANARNKYKQIFIKGSENITGTIQNVEILENQQEINDKSNKKSKRKSDSSDEHNHKRKSKLFKHNSEDYSIYNGIDNLGCTANSEEQKLEEVITDINDKIDKYENEIENKINERKCEQLNDISIEFKYEKRKKNKKSRKNKIDIECAENVQQCTNNTYDEELLENCEQSVKKKKKSKRKVSFYENIIEEEIDEMSNIETTKKSKNLKRRVSFDKKVSVREYLKESSEELSFENKLMNEFGNNEIEKIETRLVDNLGIETVENLTELQGTNKKKVSKLETIQETVEQVFENGETVDLEGKEKKSVVNLETVELENGKRKKMTRKNVTRLENYDEIQTVSEISDTYKECVNFELEYGGKNKKIKKTLEKQSVDDLETEFDGEMNRREKKSKKRLEKSKITDENKCTNESGDIFCDTNQESISFESPEYDELKDGKKNKKKITTLEMQRGDDLETEFEDRERNRKGNKNKKRLDNCEITDENKCTNESGDKFCDTNQASISFELPEHEELKDGGKNRKKKKTLGKLEFEDEKGIKKNKKNTNESGDQICDKNDERVIFELQKLGELQNGGKKKKNTLEDLGTVELEDGEGIKIDKKTKRLGNYDNNESKCTNETTGTSSDKNQESVNFKLSKLDDFSLKLQKQKEQREKEILSLTGNLKLRFVGSSLHKIPGYGMKL